MDSHQLLFKNATVFTGGSLQPNTDVLVNEGLISAVGQGLVNNSATVIDFGGDYLIPGLIDLQLYGGVQEFLNENPTPEAVRHIWLSHARRGSTTILPTMHSTSLEEMQRAMAAVKVVRDEQPLQVPGIHLEGPYFNPIKRGAHRAAFVRPPAEGELEALFSTNADVISILTLAPEILSSAQREALYRLKHPRTRLSLGHSNATYAEAMQAFDEADVTGAGFPLATHLYNAMRGFESREPGIVGAIFDHATAITSMVADGYHCDPAAIRLAHRVLGPDRLFLISDALFVPPAGVTTGPRARFALGEFVVQYLRGTGEPGQPAYGRYGNDEGKLAGTAISLSDCLQFCVKTVGLPLLDVLRMTTEIPAKQIGLSHEIGKIDVGYTANLVRLNSPLSVQSVWVNGKPLV
ncbi:N-acetylglucosamine-6-phosphate deacetylase [Fibrella sp. HMF5335]|uniref:N-acetylglucosamine-6-phosphate deacetylase n=1 Tax=Fibrella rubiginis TaxID=2817060 RepID=A0A939K3N4_9BACT|nr:N-acetylglucosamine-6-phosphate deacetylase [Fibrella rubiginis]MBO0939442.1 N-acetylglucosamine-6-phosphate deacetylase [Fibrella rubiginis]